MSALRALQLEWRFMWRERATVLALLVALVLSSMAVAGGLLEASAQNDAIAQLQQSDREDRGAALAKQSDWGSAAYYTFHLTFDPPSDFAFAALGQRDSLPWKHRIRMLAMEAQIYERDASNPVFALIGRFDFAFFAALVLPLILIALLHDLRASERAAGRYSLLAATATNESVLWRTRTTVRALAVYIVAIIPLIVGAWMSGAGILTVLTALALVAVYVVFWVTVIYCLSAWQRSAGVIFAALLSVWVALAVVIPAVSRAAIDSVISLPTASDILLTQREAVNDAWDIPKAKTMDAFVATHPQWADAVTVKLPFEWKWYYAFQQVGDQVAQPLSLAYRTGRLERDRLASKLAWLSPPALLERALQGLAGTDTAASLAYESHVRQFHAELREFFYQRLFNEQPFSQDEANTLPTFAPREHDR